jgi:hypothetical protein
MIFMMLASPPRLVPEQQKSRALSLRFAAGTGNFVRLLVAGVARARFAGPLPRKEEAVRKGEIARVQLHHALSAILLNSIVHLNRAATIQKGPGGVKRFVCCRGINAIYGDGNNCKFDLS